MTKNKAIEWLKAISATQSNSLNKNSIIDEALHKTIVTFEELEQYRAIGTVEECREAMKKQRAKISNRNWSDDLISRRELLEELKDFHMTINGFANAVTFVVMNETKKSIMRIIEEQPTIYEDVENGKKKKV